MHPVDPAGLVSQRVHDLLTDLRSRPNQDADIRNKTALVQMFATHPALPDITQRVADLARPRASLDIIGHGYERIVFDIGGGKVARIDSQGNRRYPDALDRLRPLEITPFENAAVESIWRVAPITPAEHKFLLARLRRNGWSWDDRGASNAGKLPNGHIVVIDGNVTPIIRRRTTSRRVHADVAHYDIVGINGKRGEAAELPEAKNSRWLYRADKNGTWRDSPGLSHFFNSPLLKKNVVLVEVAYPPNPAHEQDFKDATVIGSTVGKLPDDLSFANEPFSFTAGLEIA